MEAGSRAPDAGTKHAAHGAAFTGFPARPQSTAIPNVFFSDIMPQLAADPAALAVTLLAMKLLQSKRGSPRYMTAAELRGDPSLAAFLAGCGASLDTVEPALERACGIGVLLPLHVEGNAGNATLYFLNAPADRRGMEAVRAGAGVDLGRVIERATASPPQALAWTEERSGVFVLYESLVGTLSPLIADELAEAERLYPAEWLEAAFREAAAQNARSWRYVSRILERWAIEGPDHAKTERDPAGDTRYFSGKYGRILKERLRQ